MAFDIDSARKEGYSDQEISQFLSQNHPEFDVNGALNEGYSLDEIANQVNTPRDNNGILLKTWDALSIPEKKSREGLNMLTEMLTPSRQDIESGKVGIPGIAARTVGETLSEVAPSFISRGSIATAGALKGAQMALPVIGEIAASAGKQIARGAEKLSGLSYKTPGVLEDAFNDPSLILGKGTDAAREIYKTTQSEGAIRDVLKQPLSNQEYINKALEAVKDGTITSEEALEARKSLDRIKKSLSSVGYRETRKIFDAAAKEKFSKADAAFQRAVKSEALREFYPMNKSGTPSIVKTALTFLNPYAYATSPIVQGSVASGLGVGKAIASPIVNYATKNPMQSALALPILRKILNKQGE